MDPRYSFWQGWFETEAVAMAHRKGHGCGEGRVRAKRSAIRDVLIVHIVNGIDG